MLTKTEKTFEFAVATDITEFAKATNPDLYDQYEKIFITPDVTDYHVLRVLKGYGEDYENQEDSFILEHQMIPKRRQDSISSLTKLTYILLQDDGGNWDYGVFNSISECIEEVDGGFGINKL